jgi:DNA-binding NtrC family response regulator
LAALEKQAAKILAADERMQTHLPPVLILGETGTGKTTIARWIHQQGPRAGEPLVEVNCSALPETLAESELFGHERGAFTDARTTRLGLFEAAGGGTLFLDELPSLAPALQAKVLTAIEDHRIRRVGGNKPIAVDVRLIAAASRDLKELVAAGQFREDLYHRLDLFRLQLPALRERGADIVPLAEALLQRLCRRHRLAAREFSENGRKRLLAYPWPGNVRELQSCVEKVVVFSQGEEFSSDALPISIKAFDKEQHAVAGHRAIADLVEAVASSGAGGGVHEKVIGMVEEAIIRRALAQANGVQLEAAKALGISRNTLRKKALEYRITSAPPARQ